MTLHDAFARMEQAFAGTFWRRLRQRFREWRARNEFIAPANHPLLESHGWTPRITADITPRERARWRNRSRDLTQNVHRR